MLDLRKAFVIFNIKLTDYSDSRNHSRGSTVSHFSQVLTTNKLSRLKQLCGTEWSVQCINESNR